MIVISYYITRVPKRPNYCNSIEKSLYTSGIQVGLNYACDDELCVNTIVPFFRDLRYIFLSFVGIPPIRLL